VNVEMEYFVKDLDGNTIITEIESVIVKTQASFFKTLKIPPNLRTGNYVFVAQARYGTSVGTSSYLFEVVKAKEEKKFEFIGFCKDDVFCWSLSIVFVLMLFSLGAYFYFYIGAYLYHKITGGFARLKGREVPAVEVKEVKVKEENKLKKFLRNWKRRRARRRVEREKRKLKKLKEKVKRDKELLRLKKEMERLKEKKKKRAEEKKIEKRKKKIFEFFHKIGLVKTEEEKEAIKKRKQKKRKRLLRREKKKRGKKGKLRKRG
jgi:flagellar biosynthesis GTPase FlhF